VSNPRVTHRDRASSPVRGVVLAVAATLIALTAHAAGGGGGPHLGGILPVAVLVGVVAARLADRCAGRLATLGLLSAAQVAMHVLFTVSNHDHPGHDHLAMSPLSMVTAHAAAVVLTALVLSHVDGLLSRLRAAAAALLPCVVTVAAPAGPPVLTPTNWRGDDRPPATPLVRGCARRGPPRTR